VLREHCIATDEAQRLRFTGIIQRNTRRMEEVLQDLLALSRSDESTRQQRHLLLAEAAAEACRQLREMAEERQVELRLAPDIPEIEVDAAAVELCLVNYISNGIKYADERKPERWVAVRAYLTERGDPEDEDFDAEVVVEVVDNGIGVPVEARDRLFERFFRADTVSDREGTGLGLSIVQETAARVGGRAWAEFDESGEGTTFKIALPARRVADQQPGKLDPEQEQAART
jgi:signal transduction histidine kinase